MSTGTQLANGSETVGTTPWIWIIAGPNGAGKSTFTDKFLRQTGQLDIIRLNADDETRKLRDTDKLSPLSDLNLRAAQIVDAEVVACIAAKHTFLVETVPSSGKYRDDVQAAVAAGYQIGMVFISLYPPELSPLRVSERVAKGGHAVNPDTAIARYHRSHAELAWFAPLTDILMVFDNSVSDGEPQILCRFVRRNGNWPFGAFQFGVNPAVDKSMRAALNLPTLNQI